MRQVENDSPVFGEMLSRFYETLVVSVGERRDFSHLLTVSLPTPDGLITCAVLSETWLGASLRYEPNNPGRGVAATLAILTGLGGELR